MPLVDQEARWMIGLTLGCVGVGLIVIGAVVAGMVWWLR